jgi:hypothetical protein
MLGPIRRFILILRIMMPWTMAMMGRLMPRLLGMRSGGLSSRSGRLLKFSFDSDFSAFYYAFYTFIILSPSYMYNSIFIPLLKYL